MSIKKRVLEILSDGQPHSAKELATVSHRFSAAIHSLREDGYEIETIPVAHNDYVYQMPEVEKKKSA
jgi:biotin operon repressor